MIAKQPTSSLALSPVSITGLGAHRCDTALDEAAGGAIASPIEI
jgi:hypothetical protein